MTKSLRSYASKKEGPRLEFKDPRVLNDPWAVAREVCAFLNTEKGGQLVIGIGDDGALVPVERPEEEKDRLWSRLISSIAPSVPTRVRAEVLEGGGILVDVQPAEGQALELYAVRATKGRLGVFRRVGDRVVPLDWAEIRESIVRERPLPKHSLPAEDSLLDWRKELRKVADLDRMGALTLVFALEPRVESTNEAKDRVARAIEDPTAEGLRDAGMDYSRRQPPESVGRHKLRCGLDEEFYRALEVDLRGQLRFGTRLDYLLADGIAGCPRPQTIYPLTLIETIASCSVLFSALVDSSSARGKVTCALDLAGIKGHSLPPYRHGTGAFMSTRLWNDPHPSPGLDETIKSSLDADAFVENPHRLAKDLIHWIYQEFGYDASVLGPDGEKIPFWNDGSGRFEFPD
jgi:Schlafen, AlbA_2